MERFKTGEELSAGRRRANLGNSYELWAGLKERSVASRESRS